MAMSILVLLVIGTALATIHLGLLAGLVGWIIVLVLSHVLGAWAGRKDAAG